MDMITGEQVEAQNIISLFGGNVLNPEDFEIEMDLEQEEDLNLMTAFEMKEDIFVNRIQNENVSLEMGLTVLGDQLNDLRKKMARTSFYLTDLENLLT